VTPEERAERQARRESELRQQARVTYHTDRIELLEHVRELRRCSACRDVPHACRSHPPARVRELLLEAGRLLEA
jgi:hypothetical protein